MLYFGYIMFGINTVSACNEIIVNVKQFVKFGIKCGLNVTS